MRLSKFGYANKKTAKNYKSYSVLPKYFDDRDRIRYINIGIGVHILQTVGREVGKSFISKSALEEIDKIKDTVKEISFYQKRKEEIAANRLLKYGIDGIMFFYKEGLIKPTLYDFEIRRKIWHIKSFLEREEKSLKKWIWNHIKVCDDVEIQEP
jgi:hypothetical protein